MSNSAFYSARLVSDAINAATSKDSLAIHSYLECLLGYTSASAPSRVTSSRCGIYQWVTSGWMGVASVTHHWACSKDEQQHGRCADRRSCGLRSAPLQFRDRRTTFWSSWKKVGLACFDSITGAVVSRLWCSIVLFRIRKLLSRGRSWYWQYASELILSK